MQATGCPVEVNPSLLSTVVENDIKATRHGNDELMKRLMGMPAPISASWNIVEVKDALDVEGNLSASLDEGQVTARVGNLGEIDNSAISDAHQAPPHESEPDYH
jgi:hypothetical protein